MIRICISTFKTEKLFWSFCLEIRNLVYSCCYAVEYTCRFTSDIEDYRSLDPVLSTLQKADRDSLRKIWFLRSTQHFFHILVPNSLYTENGQDGRHGNASCVRRKWKRQRPLPITHSSPILIYCTRRGRLETSQFSTVTEYSDTE